MKNKYQEALDEVDNDLYYHSPKDELTVKRQDKMIKTLQELVDKETPTSVSKDEDDCFIYDYYCPNCDNILEKSFSIHYCCYCGQKLDWDD